MHLTSIDAVARGTIIPVWHLKSGLLLQFYVARWPQLRKDPMLVFEIVGC